MTLTAFVAIFLVMLTLLIAWGVLLFMFFKHVRSKSFQNWSETGLPNRLLDVNIVSSWKLLVFLVRRDFLGYRDRGLNVLSSALLVVFLLYAIMIAIFPVLSLAVI